jgi:hypothetical protein
VVGLVELEGHADLAEVGEALDDVGLAPGGLEGWKQDSDKDGDDTDDDKQLDKGEAAAGHEGSLVVHTALLSEGSVAADLLILYKTDLGSNEKVQNRRGYATSS